MLQLAHTRKTESKLVLVEMEWSRLVQEPPNLRVHMDLQAEWGETKGRGLETAEQDVQ